MYEPSDKRLADYVHLFTVVFAALVAHSAAGLAGGLTAGLALAATYLAFLANGLFYDGIDMHNLHLRLVFTIL